MNIAAYIQELRELGLRGSLFRIGWELKLRSGIAIIADNVAKPKTATVAGQQNRGWVERIMFASPREVASAVAPFLADFHRQDLQETSLAAANGRIRCFSKWTAEFGYPIDWHLNPVTNRRWNPTLHWSRVLADAAVVGDVKLTWEVARFPQAYHLSRAIAYGLDDHGNYSDVLADQIVDFYANGPFGRGVHWHSSQEVAFRLLSWLFAVHALSHAGALTQSVSDTVSIALVEGATHIARHIGYAIHAVHNNHLLSEALALYMVGSLMPGCDGAPKWRRQGRDILEQQALRQFYSDGGYIQLSHNYHRLAMQDLLCAWAIALKNGEKPADSWRDALARSVDFLVAQQNPGDGRLPNYGANDGGLPLLLSSCDYSDFRPTLQAASIASRGERLYAPGPWDEEAAWLLGVDALDAPLQPPHRRSVSFPETGFHVLRGNDDSSFSMLRCGTIRDRFSQIDMLHLDVWWKGQNVLVDGGSYLYNGAPVWHKHFVRTASHNTVTVDGCDQMLHHRRFKVLYRTRAKTLRFEDNDTYGVAAGEHYGYMRLKNPIVHRRSVLFIKDGLWVIVDRLMGRGFSRLRLHWLCGDYEHQVDTEKRSLRLDTSSGVLFLGVLDGAGHRVVLDVIRGEANPPRGWLSRYYGEKAPVPSVVVEGQYELPKVWVTVLASSPFEVAKEGAMWKLNSEEQTISFTLREGIPEVHNI